MSASTLPGSAVRQRLVEIVNGEAGYRVVGVGPDRFEFSRTIRPTWAIVCGCVFGITGLGLLFFLVRRTESCLAAVEEDHTGVRVRLTGNLDVGTRDRLRDAFTRIGSVAPGAVGPPPGHVGIALSSPDLPRIAPSPVPLAVPARPATPFAHAAAPSAPDRWEVTLDSGERLEPLGFAVIGREPVRSTDDPADAVLVRIADSTMSVSKTHLAIGVQDGSVWIGDRHSTNGTVIVDPAGATRSVGPGERVWLPEGWSVRFGERWLRVRRSAGPPGGGQPVLDAFGRI